MTKFYKGQAVSYSLTPDNMGGLRGVIVKCVRRGQSFYYEVEWCNWNKVVLSSSNKTMITTELEHSLRPTWDVTEAIRIIEGLE